MSGVATSAAGPASATTIIGAAGGTYGINVFDPPSRRGYSARAPNLRRAKDSDDDNDSADDVTDDSDDSDSLGYDDGTKPRAGRKVTRRTLRMYAYIALCVSLIPSGLGIALECFGPSEFKYTLSSRFLLAAATLDVGMILMVWPDFFDQVEGGGGGVLSPHATRSIARTWTHLLAGRASIAFMMLIMSYDSVQRTGSLGGADGGATIMGDYLAVVYIMPVLFMAGNIVRAVG